jgi:hypothetical protein
VLVLVLMLLMAVVLVLVLVLVLLMSVVLVLVLLVLVLVLPLSLPLPLPLPLPLLLLRLLLPTQSNRLVAVCCLLCSFLQRTFSLPRRHPPPRTHNTLRTRMQYTHTTVYTTKSLTISCMLQRVPVHNSFY